VNWLRACPLRKLMVLLITFIDVCFMWAAMIRGDMPGEVQAILLTMTGAVYGGYFGTSWAEDYSAKKFAGENQLREAERGED
jgi:hypothetical protein